MTVELEDDPALADALALLAQRAEQAVVPTADAHLAVTRSADGYRVTDRGDELAVVATPRAVLDVVFARVHRRAFELASLAGWVRIHGVVLRIADRRIAVVGPSGAGKTTLALAALAAGHAVEGDESFLVRAGEVVAVPRRFHVKPGAEDLVPSAATWLAAAPRLDGDPPLRLLDPTDAGLGWSLPVGPLDDVVLLTRGPGPSRLRPASATDVAPAIVGEAFLTIEPRARLVREVAGLLRAVGVHHLVNGEDRAALAALENVAPASTGG